MSHGILLQLAAILVLGVLAQWTAWRFRLPSILLLLLAGILAGRATNWLHPDQLFGDLMLPIVSLSVAVILYEGGLNLKIHELRAVGGAFVLLTTVGVVISWAIGAAAAHYVLGLEWTVAILLGAILVVTGPTVIGPILRHLRLRGNVGALLKWEGIIIDPLGATLAVLVFTVVRGGALQDGVGAAVVALVLTLVVGVVIGVLAAGILVLALARFWIPDSLHNPVSLMLMFVALTAANLLQQEAGLLAVTVMGIALANQKWVPIRHVVEFKETLTTLLISCLFIVLAARLKVDDLRGLGWQSGVFVAVLVLLARPASILAATWGSALTWSERGFLACMAPRGIVAAAISSVFALELAAAGYPSAVEIVPVTFLVVFVTVLFYGLSAEPLARGLGLIEANPQGFLFVGAEAWVRELALAIQKEGYPVLLIDTAWENICDARMAGLPCIYGSALAEATREQINYAGLGRMLAVTSNNEANSLACMQFEEDFDSKEVYQLPFPTNKEGLHEVVPLEHRGRFLFGQVLTFEEISERLRSEFKLKKSKITAEYSYADLQAQYCNIVVPLLIFKPDKTIHVCTAGGATEPKAGEILLSVVPSTVDDQPREPTATDAASS